MKLQMDYSYSYSNNKIWLFFNTDMKCKVVDMNQQLFTLEVTHENSSELFNITYVYAKCKEHLRRPLWDRLLHWSDI